MTPASSSGRIEMLNGVPIYFEVHGTGEPLLLLHGFSGCSQDWSAFIKMQSELGECEFQLIIPDMRGHGRSFATEEHDSSRSKSAQPGLAVPQGEKGQHGTIKGPSNVFTAWRHDESAADMYALLDHLGIKTFTGLGVSGGGNVLLHMATKQPERVKAMVLVSATSYFPAQARPIMRAYPDSLPAEGEKICGGATPAVTRRSKRSWRAPRRSRTAMTT